MNARAENEPLPQPKTTGTCRSCQAPIRWAVSESSGKRIPLDLMPVDDGNIVETGRTHPSGAPMVRYLKRAQSAITTSLLDDVPAPDRYVTHFATCPNADQHRHR